MTEAPGGIYHLLVTTPASNNPQAFRSLPPELRAGDAYSFLLSGGNYPATLFTLSYVLSAVINGTPARQTVSGGDIVASGNDYAVTIPSAETKNWTPGYYLWIAYVVETSTGNRTELAQGRIKILPDVAGSSSVIDPRSQNEKTLWAINQLIAGKTVSDVQTYEINGRKVEKMRIQDLIYWRGIVSGWVRKERKARGEYVRPNSAGITFGGLN